MIERWNERISASDTVYHLGDFGFPPKTEYHVTFDELGARLNGHKVLIRGNHDVENGRGFTEDDRIDKHWMWEEVCDYKELKYGKTRFVLFHYPIESWRWAHKGGLHIHGHVHCGYSNPGQKFYKPHRFDAGVDRQTRGEDPSLFAVPWHIDELRDKLNAQTDYNAVSHHAE